MSTLHPEYDEIPESGIPPSPLLSALRSSPPDSFLGRLFYSLTNRFREVLEPPPDTRALAWRIGREHLRRWREWRERLDSQFPPPDRETMEREAWANARILYEDLLPELMEQGHKGKSAIMRNGEIAEIVNVHLAYDRGLELFAGRPFSVHLIWDTTIHADPRHGWVHHINSD